MLLFFFTVTSVYAHSVTPPVIDVSPAKQHHQQQQQQQKQPQQQDLTEEKIDFELDIKVVIDSGRCVLHPKQVPRLRELFVCFSVCLRLYVAESEPLSVSVGVFVCLLKELKLK